MSNDLISNSLIHISKNLLHVFIFFDLVQHLLNVFQLLVGKINRIIRNSF